jgi:hypothetical protein
MLAPRKSNCCLPTVHQQRNVVGHQYLGLKLEADLRARIFSRLLEPLAGALAANRCARG